MIPDNTISEINSTLPKYIKNQEIKKLLKWPLVFEAIEQALIAVCANKPANNGGPICFQPKKTKTKTSYFEKTDFLHTLSAHIGNYRLPSLAGDKKFNTLACKLVTCFNDNQMQSHPLPNILGNIFLFNTSTGQLEQILEATEITAWRTASASLVATKYLYFNRLFNSNTNAIDNEYTNLSILGCSVQGRIHAIGMCNMFYINKIYLWNRTSNKAIKLKNELYSMRKNFKNINCEIIIANNVQECVKNADIIVTATFSSTPFLSRDMIKDTVHINAVGCGTTHLCELNEDIYRYKNTKIYVDCYLDSRKDFKSHDIDINGGEIGEIICPIKPMQISNNNNNGITIFQSFGMAVEDAVLAQLVCELYRKKHEINL